MSWRYVSQRAAREDEPIAPNATYLQRYVCKAEKDERRHHAAVNPKTQRLFLISFKEKTRLGSKEGRSPTFLPLYRPPFRYFPRRFQTG